MRAGQNPQDPKQNASAETHGDALVQSRKDEAQRQAEWDARVWQGCTCHGSSKRSCKLFEHSHAKLMAKATRNGRRAMRLQLSEGIGHAEVSA